MDLANEGPPQSIEIDWFWVAGALLLIGCGLESFQGTLATFEIAFSRHRTRTNFFAMERYAKYSAKSSERGLPTY